MYLFIIYQLVICLSLSPSFSIYLSGYLTFCFYILLPCLLSICRLTYVSVTSVSYPFLSLIPSDYIPIETIYLFIPIKNLFILLCLPTIYHLHIYP